MAAVHLPQLVFETTPDCGLDCRHCYNIWKRPGESAPQRANFHGSLRALKRLFRQARVVHVTFSGGEPFLGERFLELVLACRMRGKAVTIITNGCQAGEREYRSLVELGVGLFEIPIHSCLPEVHDGLTRKQGSWGKALASIAILLSLGVSVAAVVVLTRLNWEELGATLGFLKQRGIEQVLLNRFNVGGAGIREWEELSVAPMELRQAFAVADESAAELGMSISVGVCTPHCILDPQDFPHLRMPSCSPRLEERPVTLDAAGNLRVCNHSPAVLGNIHSAPLKRILRSPLLQRFARTIPRPCLGCGRFQACQGGCRAAGEQLWGSLEYGDPLLRLREPMRAAPARMGSATCR